MKIYLIVYLFRQAMAGLRANRMVQLIGIGTMTVSLLIFGFFLLLFVNLNSWVRGWGDSLFASVYIRSDAEEPVKRQVEGLIASFEGAECVRTVSSEEAMQILRRALGDQKEILDDLPDPNPLPIALDVVFEAAKVDGAELLEFKRSVEALPGVDEVVLSEDWRGRARALLDVLRIGGTMLGGLLAVGVLFIVVNTIKLTIYARREEIEIAKLVGATDWFVKTPFLLEGLVQGVLSGAVSLGILYLSYLLLSAREIQWMDIPVLEVVFVPPHLLLAVFAGSALLGVIGSLIAVSRFFDV